MEVFAYSERRNWLRVFRSTQASRMGQAEGTSVRQRRDT
jgi:hypothetical protein